jgi:hypothetical protein
MIIDFHAHVFSDKVASSAGSVMNLVSLHRILPLLVFRLFFQGNKFPSFDFYMVF